MENKKLTKEQLEQIKATIEYKISALKDMYREDIKRMEAYTSCIPLLEQQLKLAEEQLKEFKEEPKKA